MSRRSRGLTNQHGRFSKLSVDQVAAIRRIHREYLALRELRSQLCNEMQISATYFCSVGRGVAGKKPRATV